MDFLSLVKVGIQGPFSYWSKWGLQGSLNLLSLSYLSNWGLQGSLDLLSLSCPSFPLLLVKMEALGVPGSAFPLRLVKLGPSWIPGSSSLSYSSNWDLQGPQIFFSLLLLQLGSSGPPDLLLSPTPPTGVFRGPWISFPSPARQTGEFGVSWIFFPLSK
jgi:hypothetical protein